jgi:hypothetical protein
LQNDEPIEGAVVSCDNHTAISDKNGAYILRNLAAGKMTILARHQNGLNGGSRIIELNHSPEIKSEVNLLIVH